MALRLSKAITSSSSMVLRIHETITSASSMALHFYETITSSLSMALVLHEAINGFQVMATRLFGQSLRPLPGVASSCPSIVISPLKGAITNTKGFRQPLRKAAFSANSVQRYEPRQPYLAVNDGKP